jgi:hypothetical protein
LEQQPRGIQSLGNFQGLHNHIHRNSVQTIRTFLSKLLPFFWFCAKSIRLFLVLCEKHSPFSGLTSEVLALFWFFLQNSG